MICKEGKKRGGISHFNRCTFQVQRRSRKLENNKFKKNQNTGVSDNNSDDTQLKTDSVHHTHMKLIYM